MHDLGDPGEQPLGGRGQVHGWLVTHPAHPARGFYAVAQETPPRTSIARHPQLIQWVQLHNTEHPSSKVAGQVSLQI